jgi:serine/threonine protein phosphatase PrpC
MNKEAKPQMEEEKERIEEAGGIVTRGRVEGCLNLSRTLGDHEFKDRPDLPKERQKIVAVPEVRVAPLDKAQFIVVACDGIWDCLKPQECVDFISK